MKRRMLMLGLILFTLSAQAQQTGVPFNGLLNDAMGKPVKSAKIYVHDPHKYAVSNKKGRFGLTDVKDTDTLHIIFKKSRYEIPVQGRKSLAIRLVDNSMFESEESQELVDLGYGYISRREYTGSSSRITGDDIRMHGYSSVLDAIRGRIPGVSVSQGPSGMTVNIRGSFSIYGDTKPLFLVDGVECESLDFVNVHDVDYIEVLKDANNYGVKGANGVIIVKTRR